MDATSCLEEKASNSRVSLTAIGDARVAMDASLDASHALEQALQASERAEELEQLAEEALRQCEEAINDQLDDDQRVSAHRPPPMAATTSPRPLHE